MPTKIAENTWLPNTAFRSQAVAHTEVIRSLAGRTRYLYELLTGDAPSDAPCTPVNPDGDLGINYSGPPWGSAMLTPIAWIDGTKIPGSASAIGVRSIVSKLEAGTAVLQQGIAPEGRISIDHWHVRARPYAPIDEGKTGRIAPYSRGALLLEGWASAGTVPFTVRVKNGDGPWLEYSHTGYTSTGPALIELAVSNIYVPLNPTGTNDITIEVLNDDLVDTLHITAIGIVQRAKRSH